MSAVERAAALGAEHGRRDAEAWLLRDPVVGQPLPEPDLSRDNHALDNLSCVHTYESAYREAVESTVREKCSS